MPDSPRSCEEAIYSPGVPELSEDEVEATAACRDYQLTSVYAQRLQITTLQQWIDLSA